MPLRNDRTYPYKIEQRTYLKYCNGAETFYSYDPQCRITSKKQHLTQSNVQFNGSLNAGYDLTYTYNNDEGKKFQLASVRDINYRTEETPTDSTNINNGHKYTYDANGNLVYINTSRVKRDGKEDEKASEQKYKWDEENRLLAADENGFVSNYWYDADGKRTVKTSGENEAIFVNSEFSGGNTGTARFSLYVSPYLVVGQGGKYTKHIYVGSQRIVSKLGDLASYGADPRRIPYAGNEADGLTINYKDKYAQQLQSIKDNYKTFDLPYNGVDNTDYVNGKGFSSNDDTPEAAQARAMNASTRAVVDNNFHDKDNYEKLQFYYHPDHLGSSSYITNLDGEVSQHIEYVPFGEVFIEERNNTWNTPYLFNAKEFDEETGMYYYGARYYEPRLSLWMSVDPSAEEKPWLTIYCYTRNNPIILVDPDGRDEWEINSKGDIVKQIKTDKHDAFFFVSKAGKRVKGKSLSFEYGTIEKASGQKTDGGTRYDVYQVRGDKHAKQLFESFAKNTSVEWSIMQTGTEGAKGLNYLTTSHNEKSESGMVDLFNKQLKNGYTLRAFYHSHPSNVLIPSNIGGKYGDIPIAKKMTEISNQSITFGIYGPKSGEYVTFGPNSKIEDYSVNLKSFTVTATRTTKNRKK